MHGVELKVPKIHCQQLLGQYCAEMLHMCCSWVSTVLKCCAYAVVGSVLCKNAFTVIFPGMIPVEIQNLFYKGVRTRTAAQKVSHRNTA